MWVPKFFGCTNNPKDLTFVGNLKAPNWLVQECLATMVDTFPFWFLKALNWWCIYDFLIFSNKERGHISIFTHQLWRSFVFTYSQKLGKVCLFWLHYRIVGHELSRWWHFTISSMLCKDINRKSVLKAYMKISNNWPHH